MKILSFIFIMLVVSSCTCHKDEIKPVKPMQFKDKHLNCKELQYALMDASFKKEIYQKKAEAPELYAGSVSCFAATSMQLTRAANAAEDREKYLTILYQNKGCNAPKNIIPKPHSK